MITIIDMRWTALALVALILTGCSGGGDGRGAGLAPTPTPHGTRGRPTTGTDRLEGLLRTPLPTRSGFPAYAVDARKPAVPVYDAPGGRVVRSFRNPLPSGNPLVFLLDRQQGDWLHVFLPARPNGSSGWIRVADGAVRGVPYRVDVLRGAHRLRLYAHGALSREFPIAVGTRDTPTPGGTFYLKELIAPTNPGGFYGPYAYGLSGFSEVYERYRGGEGVIGLHGTNDPSSIGRDVSHGCIRLRNADITYLARLLPLGTPVRILP